jgi:hypothetical protein
MTHPVDQMSVVMLSAIEGKCDTQKGCLTNIGGVVCRPEDQFWGSVIPRTDVADVGLSCDQDLGRAKVTQFEDAGGRVQQEILRLDIPVTDSNRVNVSQGPE